MTRNDWRIDFVIAGAQKCGTTTLDAMLRDHAAISMCKKKEAHFFDQENSENYADYHRLFPHDSDAMVVGEATPSYLYVTGAMERLWRYNKDLKILVVLRDPAARAYSHWNMLRAGGEIALSFGEAIRNEPALIGSPGNYETKKFAFLARSRYVRQLKTMRSFFPAKQCLILKYESLFSNLDCSMEQVFEFLNVDVVSLPARRERIGEYVQKIPDIDVEYIASQFRDELDALQQMVDFDISDWPSARNF